MAIAGRSGRAARGIDHLLEWFGDRTCADIKVDGLEYVAQRCAQPRRPAKTEAALKVKVTPQEPGVSWRRLSAALGWWDGRPAAPSSGCWKSQRARRTP